MYDKSRLQLGPIQSREFFLHLRTATQQVHRALAAGHCDLLPRDGSHLALASCMHVQACIAYTTSKQSN